MSITLIPQRYRTRNYPSGSGFNTFLLANSGQKIEQDLTHLYLTFSFESSIEEPVMINDDYSFKALGFNWGDKGFVIGDNIDFSYTLDGGSITVTTANRNIVDIQGDLMILDDLVCPFPNSGALLPMNAGNDTNSTIEFRNLTRSLPEQIEIFHNIVNNSSSPNKNSLIDGEQNRFLAENVDTMLDGDTRTLIQQGNKSGGSYIFAELSRFSDDGILKRFTITFVYYTPWKIEDSTFNKPTYLTSSQSLKPCYFVKAYAEENNPNAALTIDGYGFNQGNTGWCNESYNQGQDDFVLNSLTITDSTGQIINEVDHL